MKKYDLVVIGAGPGGYVAAIKAAQLGLSAAIVEEARVGGTCLNRGCIPAKAMLHAAELYREAAGGGRFGIHAAEVTFDYGEICRCRECTIDQLVRGVESLLDANGVTRYEGRGRLLPDRVVEIAYRDGTESIAGDHIVIATGSAPSLPPIPGIDLEGVVTSDGLFAMERLPESIVIIGGGVIGVEFAQALSDLGCRVTILEALPRLLASMDREISQSLKMLFGKRGVELHTGASVSRIEGSEAGLAVTFTEKEEEQTVHAPCVLVAAGRRANTEGLLGDGVELAMERDRILVDERLETSIPGVYAIGDVIPGIQLAHVAEAEGAFVAEEIAALRGSGAAPQLRLDVVPGCVYTNPEIGSVGMTEAEARAAGVRVRTGKFVMTANGRSLISGEERGFVKIVAAEDTGQILGAQLMCGRATDLIGEFVTAMANGLTAEDMLRGMRAHPTYNEGIGEALEELAGSGAIHAMPRRRKKQEISGK